jgi:mannose-6-phosphate isomerase-like protein (cupin superfamily)
MRIPLSDALARLPLPASDRWPEGVWDAEALRHGTMSLIVFTPRGKDYQTAHSQDELYIVHKGSGVLRIGNERHAFVAGDALFVPARSVHRFEEFSDDFVTWAVFWGPQGGEADAVDPAPG